MTNFEIIDNFFDKTFLEKIAPNYRTPHVTDYFQHFIHGYGNDLMINEEVPIPNDRLFILEYLISADNSPFKKMPYFKNTQISFRKPVGGFSMNPHRDFCFGTMSVYLNPNWKPEWGGEFYCIDTETGEKKVIDYKFNRAVFWKSPHPTEPRHSPSHGVRPTHRTDRFTLQVFIYDTLENEKTYEEMGIIRHHWSKHFAPDEWRKS